MFILPHHLRLNLLNDRTCIRMYWHCGCEQKIHYADICEGVTTNVWVNMSWWTLDTCLSKNCLVKADVRADICHLSRGTHLMISVWWG